METDTCDSVFIGGITTSHEFSYDYTATNTLNQYGYNKSICHSLNYGFFLHHNTATGLETKKMFDGSPELGEYVVSVPWIGIGPKQGTYNNPMD
jgi:hypothetical protein